MLNNLNAQTIPLVGKHLIEASAGTGKTFNITRIYLRLLLERNLSVDQILVMTFTKDATEELRGRIDDFIREALNNWEQLTAEDPYFIALAENIDQDSAKLRLKQALLHIDEAAIFTIHGFCKRVLSQHAFTSGLSLSLSMEADCQDLLLEACQDWYRILSVTDIEKFICVTQFWQQPDSFLRIFGKAIQKIANHEHPIDVISPIDTLQHFISTLKRAQIALTEHQTFLFEHLVNTKKGAEKEKREQEFNQLNQWLSNLIEQLKPFHTNEPSLSDIQSINFEIMPDSFIDGRRYARAKVKTELIECLVPVNQIKSQVKTLKQSLLKGFAYRYAREGISLISEQFNAKKKAQFILNFDDLITTLVNALQQDKQGRLSTQVYEQFPVALVDEFQDTDPLQFELLESIYFKQIKSALYLIGDPKQAIYGFRGGDIFTYLSAREICEYQWVMDTNWRSTPEMISAYNRLFYGAPLNDTPQDVFGYNIPYVPVLASPKALKQQKENTLVANKSALNFVHFNESRDIYRTSKKSDNLKQNFRVCMAQWCAQEIVELLTLSQASNAQPAVLAQDIAILVRDGAEAADIKMALEACNLASVYLSNRANLLLSEQTQQLLLLLKGVLYAENERLFTAALTSPLLGISPAKLIELQQDEIAWQNYKFAFIHLKDLWLKQGFMRMAVTLMHEHFNIAVNDRDRVLTNVLHLFELLQAATQKHHQPHELLYWFEHQISLDNPDIESELRLESDDNLIRIITQHGAKGLEYPVVFIPFATRHKNPLRFGSSNVSFIEYHDKNGKLNLSLDGSEQAKSAMADEAYAESIRLLYVAVTRAESNCYILSAQFDGFATSPLGKTLRLDSRTSELDKDLLQSLSCLAQDTPEAINVITVDDYESPLMQYHVVDATQTPKVTKFEGYIERDWWLSSFSALSRNLKHNGISTPDRDIDLQSNPINLKSFNEVEGENEPSTAFRFSLKKGAQAGNLLHDLFEHTDFTSPDWTTLCEWVLPKYAGLLDFNEVEDAPKLIEWLNSILYAPLISHCSTMQPNHEHHFCLKDIPFKQTLREREFYFPMNSASTQQLTQLIKSHRGNTVNNLYLPGIKQLKGMMHGFIDLIFCYDDKYYICDYKSNYLGDKFSDYSYDNLKQDIEKHHYDLQYLIYILALHRHLKKSLVNYDPEIHLGGIYYLYLRGMKVNPTDNLTTLTETSPSQGSGVYHRRILRDEIQTLDAIFSNDVSVSGVKS